MQSFHFATRVFELGCRVIALRRHLRRAPKGSQGDAVGFVGSYRVSSEHSVCEGRVSRSELVLTIAGPSSLTRSDLPTGPVAPRDKN